MHKDTDVLENVRRFVINLRDMIVSDGLLVISASIAILAALGFLILSAGLVLILAPFAIGGALYLRWRIRRALERAGEGHAQTIDTEYHIVEIKRD